MEDISTYKPNWKILFSDVDMDDFLGIPRKKLDRPGIYRWYITNNSSTVIYVGESMNVGRRIYHYKKPGARQKTNIRINKILKEYQAKGYSLNIHLLEFSGIKFNENIIVREEDMNRKYNRLIIENIVIAYYSKVNKYSLLNLTIDK